MNLGKAICVAIAMKETSQNKVNDKAGMSVGHLNRVINGSTSGVTIGILERVSDALDMKLSELISLGESD